MRVTVNPRELRTALRLARRFTARHSTLPILSCVLLDAEGDRLTLSGTNLEACTQQRVAATVRAVGRVAVDAALRRGGVDGPRRHRALSGNPETNR